VAAPDRRVLTHPAGSFVALGLLAGLLGGWVAAVSARRRRLDLRGAVALVVGGSRGLGLELARELGRHGARVAICARDHDTLERARRDLDGRGVEALALTCDVTDQAATAATVQAVHEHWGRLDILVNNAGVIQVGPITTMTLDDFRHALAVNFWGPLHATWAALPLMRAQGGGRIVNIVSIGGKLSAPHLAPYTASKFALAGWSEALHAELAAEGIRVTTVYPGLMRTGSPRHALFKGRHRVEFAWFSIADALPLVSISVQRAAGRIVRASQHGASSLMLPWPARLAALAPALLPATTAMVLALVNRVLPRDEASGPTPRRGRDSESAWSPSVLTALGERAARTQNQLG
jgi:NAD(P)-dependent dehydrogenase (short-subunit alcohol dehydrogenase family)